MIRPENDAPIEHELRCWPPFYGEIALGRKTFDVRLNDRQFHMLDVLHLREWLPDTYDAAKTRFLSQGYTREQAEFEANAEAYSGKSLRKMVGYILYGVDPALSDMEARHAGIAAGYVVLSLVPTVDESRAKREAWERRLADMRSADGLPKLGTGISVTGAHTR